MTIKYYSVGSISEINMIKYLVTRPDVDYDIIRKIDEDTKQEYNVIEIKIL